MSEPACCPSCGGQLSPDSPSGLCPECLLSAGLEGDGAGRMEREPLRTPQPGLFVPPQPASLAAYFPHLDVLELLGHGGMGAVYMARQTKLDRFVALKILRPESAADPAFAERFNREARTLARMRHPHIVGIHDFGEVAYPGADEESGNTGRLFYFLMEYVDGASLREPIRAGTLRSDHCLAIVAQICDAMQFAHDEHVVHRDLKPENILIDSKGYVRVADFGLAKLVALAREDFTLTGTHQVMGTPRYMAPEQMEDSNLVDHRADIYSLGVMFYEMLTGELPVGQFEPPSRKARVDPRLDQIVLRALAREPHRRYQHVRELRQDIAAVAGSSVMNSIEQLSPARGQPAHNPFDRDMTEHEHELLKLDARGPAGGLILVGSLSAGFWVILGMALLSDSFRPGTGEFTGLLGAVVAAVLAGCFLVFSGFKLRNLSGYDLCMAASILAILPWSPLALLGIPVGIWCIRTLRRTDVKVGFVREALRRRGIDNAFVPAPYSQRWHLDGREPELAEAMSASEDPPYGPPGPSTLFERGFEAIGRLFKLP